MHTMQHVATCTGSGGAVSDCHVTALAEYDNKTALLMTCAGGMLSKKIMTLPEADWESTSPPGIISH